MNRSNMGQQILKAPSSRAIKSAKTKKAYMKAYGPIYRAAVKKKKAK